MEEGYGEWKLDMFVSWQPGSKEHIQLVGFCCCYFIHISSLFRESHSPLILLESTLHKHTSSNALLISQTFLKTTKFIIKIGCLKCYGNSYLYCFLNANVQPKITHCSLVIILWEYLEVGTIKGDYTIKVELSSSIQLALLFLKTGGGNLICPFYYERTQIYEQWVLTTYWIC